MMTIKKVVSFFIIWRFILFAGFLAGSSLQPPLVNYLGGSYNDFTNPILWSWANFDGVHYLFIAQYGYGQFQQAFFPFYPMLISLVSRLLQGNYLISALFISHLSLIAALFFLYKLIKIDFSEKVANWTILFMLFFPTSFYLGSVYTESLFLLFLVLALYASRRQMWWLAGLVGAFASLTKLVGIFLFPAILWEYYMSIKFPADKKLAIKKFFNPNFFWLMLIPLGLCLYMFWLNQTYHDPFAFIHVQPAFGAARSGGQIILLPQVVFRYIKIFLTASFSYQYFIALLEFFTFFAFLGMLIFGAKKIRISYWIFALMALILPTLSGSFTSIPRYVATLFPSFLLLGLLNNNLTKSLILLLFFLILLILFTALFTRGYWIS